MYKRGERIAGIAGIAGIVPESETGREKDWAIKIERTLTAQRSRAK